MLERPKTKNKPRWLITLDNLARNARMSIRGFNCKGGVEMGRLSFLKDWYFWFLLAIIAGFSPLLFSGCAQWQAEDRYHIGPDPTRPTQEEVDDLGLRPTDYPDYKETIQEYPTAYTTAKEEVVVEARLRLDIAPPEGVACAIQYWELVWEDLPIVMT